MGAAESCNKVVFECADSSFSCIATVHSWGNNLIIHLGFFCHMFLQDARTFIVQSVEFWFETSLGESGMADFACFKDGFC